LSFSRRNLFQMRMTATIRKRARTEMEMARAYHVD
jgi:hypothetical protein